MSSESGTAGGNESYRGEMTSQEPSPTARRFLRSNLRPATLILPRTGERVKRNFSLRTPGLLDGGSEDGGESEPLLGRRSSAFDRGGIAARMHMYAKEWSKKSYNFATSKTGIGIFKCSIAYLLGSMATFVPPVAALLGKNDGKHMVATITVYFHPARSAGSMHRATLLALVAFAYAAFISFTSMGVSIFFDDHDLLILGHAIVLIVFCGGGLGFVGWLKQRLGDPLVNVACSLTSLSLITILTKEGAVQTATFSFNKVSQVLKMVIMGIFATTAVSLIIKPIRAREELRQGMIRTTDSLGEMLIVITKSFLTGSDYEIEHPKLREASAKHTSLINALPDQLYQAKYEHYVRGTEKEYRIEAELVKCMQKLAHNIGALRGAASIQFRLVSQFLDMPYLTPARSNSLNNIRGQIKSPESITPEEPRSMLSSIHETPEEESDINEMLDSVATFPGPRSAIESASSPPEMFSMFIAHLGPPMKSLAYTLKQILDELPFRDNDGEIEINSNFRSSLSDAIDLFRRARKQGLELVYKNKELHKTRAPSVAADYEEVAASCGYFSSSLEDFAEDMLNYLDILEELKAETEKQPRKRTWWWLCFWRRRDRGHEDEDFPQGAGATDMSHEQPAHLPGVTSADWDPHQYRRYTYKVWRALGFFRRDDIKFAIKVGAGAAIYALPSFVPEWRPFYSHWRGEWGLLSYMLVCSMTIGASNTTGYQRFFGTCVGAICAVVAWLASNANPFVLAFLGWLVSLGCFYLIIAKGKGPMGRFILLTYNLSALYAYSLSVKDDDHDDDEGGTNPEIWQIVPHRVMAVMTGCIWGIIVTRLIWPISARQKLKDGLALLWLRMGLIWRRDPLSTVLEGTPVGPQSVYMDIREEFELHRFLAYLESLRKSAASEFELRGAFPEKEIKRVLETTGRMLDAFHAMNVVIMKDSKATPGEAEVLRWTREERNQISQRISHLFSVLASSLKLEYSLTSAVPKVEHTRDRFLAKIFEFKKNASSRVLANNEDFELLYAYALVTGQLSRQIDAVGKEIEGLFGVPDEDNMKLQ
ncbi:MAG: hypothetical protein M1822_007273 [Bathelium mastoideum]|nr:MAG: hypothetical protein M1822_007273 [Bathelium mastoideum]